MIRPELQDQLRPWREVIAAVACLVFGAWVFTLGGYIFRPLGAFIVVVCLIWTVTARRQMRFLREAAAPGLLEIDEGAVRYYGARLLGGEISLRELAEIRLLMIGGRQHWRLKSTDGQALLIPVDAAGAARLGEAFATLPGADMGRISAAIGQNSATFQTVWTRPDRVRLT